MMNLALQLIAGFAGLAGLLLIILLVYDLAQKKHAILRNFPLLGHFRYFLEKIGPELRQYIISRNDEEKPFTRDQRAWIYTSSKKRDNNFGFGTDNDLEQSSNYIIFKHSSFPIEPAVPDEAAFPVACRKIIGAARGRAKAFRPASLINVSGMSYGSLGRTAIEAINRGCALAGCWQNTGEGGVSQHHLHGGDLVWQIGTAYFGCRDEEGKFNLERLKAVLARAPHIRSLEIKLSQGAKPGAGGILPKDKITEEIAAIRHIRRDRDCISPSRHHAFSDVDSMLDFVEMLAAETGLPVGIKSAVGQASFWQDLARLMARGDRGVDFIVIDGGEGGTGAAPLVYADHVSLPFKLGFSRVRRLFEEAGLAEKIAFIGAGKLGFPDQVMVALALGCDLVSIGREAMLAIGCIQAQVCHTNHCPAGVATTNPWLMHGLDPTLKSARLANYIITLRKEILKLGRSLGLEHPAQMRPDLIEILDSHFHARPFAEVFDGKWD